MADIRKNIVLRFGIIYFIVLLAFGLVIYKIISIQTVEREPLMAQAAKNTPRDFAVNPVRGNIYAADGRLMASSIPSYYVYMDTRVPALHLKNGQLFKENIDSVAYCLSRFFGDRSTAEYKRMITNAYNRGEGELLLYPRRISHAQLKELRTFPLFRQGRNKSGLITKEYVQRVKPFGSLASRTVGDVYADNQKGGKNGIELYFDEQLKGKPGMGTRQKIANTWSETIKVEPVAGMDIFTTIDVDIQDIAERALLEKIQDLQAEAGSALLMEVATGELKAIVNMQRNGDGTYSENRNDAVSDKMEPGSTFKTMTLMAALDDGKIKITDTIDTGKGIYTFRNSSMIDHNYRADGSGGYGKITLAQAIHSSSNVGISKAIVNAYGDNPSQIINKIYSMKLNEPIDFEIPGTAHPYIKSPSDPTWSHTSLPWMSIGYEVQIPPIYTLMYYNAIANNRKMIRPFLVKSIKKNGAEVKTYSTEVINRSICSSSTLKDIHEALIGVVEAERGTAKNVRSPYVRIAGKTGTAQISKGTAGYRVGGRTHLVSFCGYFPADNPKYTCLVTIKAPRAIPASGPMAGSVLKEIAERVTALDMSILSKDFAQMINDDFSKAPYIKRGHYKSVDRVMSRFNYDMSGEKSEWTNPLTNNDTVFLHPVSINTNLVPNVVGMGAKDAVYLLEQAGLKVQLNGRGRVVSQSMSSGIAVQKGRTIVIELK